VAVAVGQAAFAPVHAPPRRYSNRFMKVAAGTASLVLVVVALAAFGEQRRNVSLGEDATATAISFQQDSQAALAIKDAKEHYDDARGEVHTLKEGLTGLETKLADQLKVMDAARDDLVKRIKKVERLPEPAPSKRIHKALQASTAEGGTNTALASRPLKQLAMLKGTSSKVKTIAKRIMFPDGNDKDDPLTNLDNSVLEKGWSDHRHQHSRPRSSDLIDHRHPHHLRRDAAKPSAWVCRRHPDTPGCDTREEARGKASHSYGSSAPSAWACRTKPSTPGCKKAGTASHTSSPISHGSSEPSDWQCRGKPQTPGCEKHGDAHSDTPSDSSAKSQKSKEEEDDLDKDVVKDLKKIVHRHLRSVSAGVEAARTTRDAADAAEHALGYTQHIATEVGDLAQQTEKQADRVVAAAKLTAEARDAMRAALQQSSQIVDYNTHAARAVAQDAGFVTTASSAIAKYLDGIFADRKTVRKVSAAVLSHLRKVEKKADDEIGHIEKDESIAIKYDKYSHKAYQRSDLWSQRSSVAAKTAASAADHSLQGEQAALQSGMKALGYARSAREANRYAQQYAGDAQRASEYGKQWASQSEQNQKVAASHARYAAIAREDAEWQSANSRWANGGNGWNNRENGSSNGGNAWTGGESSNWADNGFWGPQSAPRSHTQMPFWRNPTEYPPAYSDPQAYAPQSNTAPNSNPPYSNAYPYALQSNTAPYSNAPYSNAYPYTPFGTAPYGYGLQGSGASPLKRAKELVDSVVVLMQHLTRSLEAAGPNCQLVNGYLAAYQRGMATYRAQGVGLGNLLSDEDMKLVERYAEVQVQSFASDLEDAMANAESYCGLAGGVSLANGAPTVALGSVTTTHQNPYMRCPPLYVLLLSCYRQAPKVLKKTSCFWRLNLIHFG